MTWVDVQNYGVYMASDHEQGLTGCSAMKDWWNDWKGLMDRRFRYGPRWTGGDAAYSGWKHSYMKTGVFAHDCPKALALESGAYFGGRCEAFRIGSIPEPVYHLDYRSLYPSVCINRNLPVRLCYVYPHDGRLPSVSELQPDRSIATVTVRTSRACYPYRHNGDVIYPIGTFTTTLAGPELEVALYRGEVVDVHEVAEYCMEPVLSEYMNDMYAERCAAEEGGKELLSQSIKHLLVSLPGKFAQRSRRWVVVPYGDADIQYGIWYGRDPAGNLCRCRCMGGEVEREEEVGWAHDAVPAIGAWITSAGRVRLLQAIEAAGWKNVYYCDTDSVLVNEVGFRYLQDCHMVHDGLLGMLSVKRGPVNVHVYGIKWYIEDGKVTCSGQPKGDKKDCGDGQHYRMKLPLTSYLKKGERPQADMRTFRYNRSLIYRHGVVHEDGTVTPHEMG